MAIFAELGRLSLILVLIPILNTCEFTAKGRLAQYGRDPRLYTGDDSGNNVVNDGRSYPQNNYGYTQRWTPPNNNQNYRTPQNYNYGPAYKYNQQQQYQQPSPYRYPYGYYGSDGNYYSYDPYYNDNNNVNNNPRIGNDLGIDREM